MLAAQAPELLALDCAKLTQAITQASAKFGELPIAGLDELDCNVPAEEITKAKGRLNDARRAQARQQRARSRWRCA